MIDDNVMLQYLLTVVAVRQCSTSMRLFLILCLISPSLAPYSEVLWCVADRLLHSGSACILPPVSKKYYAKVSISALVIKGLTVKPISFNLQTKQAKLLLVTKCNTNHC